MIYELMALGLITWGLIIAFFIALVVCEATDSPGFAALGVAVVLGLLWYNGVFNVWLWTKANPGTLVLYVLSYWFAGVLWSFFKWDRYVAHQAALKWDRPEVLKNKRMITNWVVLWPFSVLRYVFGNLIADIVTWIIERFDRVYEAITDRHYPTKSR